MHRKINNGNFEYNINHYKPRSILSLNTIKIKNMIYNL